MRKIGFHGTSIQAATAIKEHGYIQPFQKNWKASTGMPFVTTSKDVEEYQDCFELAFKQAMGKAVKEPYIVKRAVIIFDLEGKTTKFDNTHCPQYAYEVLGKFESYNVLGIWVDEYDLSDFRPFLQRQLKNNVNYIPDTTHMSKTQEIIANGIKNVSFDEMRVPVKELYYKSRYYNSWIPTESMIQV